MKPVLGTAQLRAAESSSGLDVEQLISRAGFAVARCAIDMLGSAYGKRVIVLAGKGNNGGDGRVAARHLQSAGAAVRVIEAADITHHLDPCDLVIDAVFGTGFHGDWEAPIVDAPVLAVDVPSGVNADTGEASNALEADRTITMISYKPGLLFDPGFSAAGEVVVADLGIEVNDSDTWLIDSLHPEYSRVPVRDQHKWTRSVTVVAGSPGMTGAANLVCRAAMRSGAGMVRLCAPGIDPLSWRPSEVVVEQTPATAWVEDVLRAAERSQALVVGPGLGRSDESLSCIRQVIDSFDGTVVVDGDGLHALSGWAPSSRGALIVTPHDGEYKAITGAAPGADRGQAADDLAKQLGAVVLLKGATTVVTEGICSMLVVQPDGRLGTAGTGDVLSGILAGMAVARPIVDDEMVASAAFVHGEASRRAPGRGLIASDLIDKLPGVFADA